jgi:hypothetical protein
MMTAEQSKLSTHRVADKNVRTDIWSRNINTNRTHKMDEGDLSSKE